MDAPNVDSAVVQLRALQELIIDHAVGLADRIAKNTARKYPWIDPEDLRQELIIPLSRWLNRYNPGDVSRTSWSKYLYHKMNFYVKDVLRREDPAGICWPQRGGRYPTWFRLGDQTARFKSNDVSPDGSGQGDDCPSEMLGKSLVVDVDLVGDEEEQLWRRDLAGLNRLAAKNRKRKALTVLVDAGAGVCRAVRCPFFDRTANRVRFNERKIVRLSDYMAQRGGERQQTFTWYSY